MVGAALSSSLDRGSAYAERTRRLGEGRTLGCRAVLILTALLILLMPLTEYLYGWDKFLQGGSDVEFGILCLLLFAGLVVLMAHRAVTSPHLVLLSYGLIVLPLRCLRLSGLASLPFASLPLQVQCSPEPPLAFSLPAIPLRI